LIDPNQINPALPLGHPFTNVESAVYWSATASVFPASAWLVFVSDGSVNFGDKTFSNRVWCVRGGMNADVY